MAKKRASKKSSTRSEPPLPPKDTSAGKQLTSRVNTSQTEAIRMYDRQVSDLQDRLRNMRGEGMGQSYQNRRQDPSRSIRSMEIRIESMQKNAPTGSRYNPNRSMPSNVSVPRLPDKLSGRTSEFGTRSLLEGMKSWMRGGGLRRGSM